MATKYASGERLEKGQIENQYNEITNLDFINNIFNSLPYIAAVLNEHRQIIFSNQVLLKQLGVGSIESILGARPGEMLSCVNAKKEAEGCGTSEECKYCGAVNAILNSQKSNKKVESECTIVSEVNGDMETYEFGVVVNPFIANEKQYYILSLFDISDSKRRLFLEKIFFHDILNKVGSLNGFLQLIHSVSDPSKLDEYIKTLDTISQELINEIFTQKQLLEAENGTLQVNKELINTRHFGESMVLQIAQHEVAKNIKVELSETTESVSFFSDSTLLGRVVFNMLKNAAEASKSGDKVMLDCVKKGEKVKISVHNPTVMPPEVKSSIFKRSFSTKGTGRGLGTYSMKVLTENYLDGQISFTSQEGKGTCFSIELSIE